MAEFCENPSLKSTTVQDNLNVLTEDDAHAEDYSIPVLVLVAAASLFITQRFKRASLSSATGVSIVSFLSVICSVQAQTCSDSDFVLDGSLSFYMASYTPSGFAAYD
jgi:hypothetical protein